jgi:EAL domain-containing protein (putative c-di-GMP-specific phosphodiesterase class I)
MNIESFKRLSLKNDLRKAVNNNQFFVDYQPKVETKTHKIIGMEALIRWEHPKWGIVSPEEFILLAEESGLICSLGEMVLTKACQQNKKWQDQGLTPIKVSVNFSVVQFLQSDIIQMVEKVLKDTGMEAKWLEIEITESTLLTNEELVLEIISKLKAMGISIAIDDFGTGYASLSYLQKLKADTLKIDRSFVKGIPSDTDSTNIISAIIHLAQKLHINTVAEGVETMEQLQFLKKIHCDEIQGYYFSRPISPQDFVSLLKKKICMPILTDNEDHADWENRRKYFRINLTHPLSADMTISLLGGNKVQLGSTKVFVLDIGPGGLRIKTHIKLPVRKDLVLQFTTKVLGENLELYGLVVWKKEMDDVLTYGINLIMDGSAQRHLTSLLNKFQIMLRNKDVLPDCSFVMENEI